MLGGGVNGAVAVKAGNTMVLSPGGMIRFNDLENLRVLATKKGLILRAGNNGRRSLKLLWKAGAAPGKGAAAAAKGAQAKALAASAKSMAVSAETLAKTAKTMSAPAKAIAGASAAKATAGSIWAGTAAGLGLGLGPLGPVLVLGGLAAAAGGIYVYLQKQRPPEPAPEY